MIALVSAPTNLGLRPPEPGAVPGTSKAPEALREAGLHAAMLATGAIDAGVVLPGRYIDRDAGGALDGVRNLDAVVDHARRLAHRLVRIRDAGHAPLVLGGDCSLIVAAGLANRVTGDGGLVHVDGHTDFRHPGNSDAVGALAGEDLAVAIGRHDPSVADIDGLGPYFASGVTAHVGCREDDDDIDEVRDAIALVVPAAQIILHGGAHAAERVLATQPHPFWVQIDVDVLDPHHMPAVDSPDPGGISPDELTAFLARIAPRAWGASVTVFDPDLDPDGAYARLLAEIIIAGCAELGRDVRPAG